MEKISPNISDYLKGMDIYKQFALICEDTRNLQTNPSVDSVKSILIKLEELLNNEEFKDIFGVMVSMRDRITALVQKGKDDQVTNDEAKMINGFNLFANSITVVFGILQKVSKDLDLVADDCFCEIQRLNNLFMEIKYP